MSDYSESYQWTAGRGDKWSQQLVGMEGMLASVDAPLFDALRVTEPCSIADVGCGGGGTTIELLRRAPPGTTVHGFDVSTTLVEAARSRVAGLPNAPLFTIADATTATPAPPFDRLVSRFGVMFFDDETAAFDNLSRWLRPGGRFAFAVWSTVATNPWLQSVRDVVTSVAPMVSTPPSAPGPMRYADPAPLLELLWKAGFVNLEVARWTGLLPMGGGLPAAEAAHFALAALSSFSEILEKAGGDAFARAHATLAEHYANHERDGIVKLGASVHIVTGGR